MTAAIDARRAAVIRTAIQERRDRAFRRYRLLGFSATMAWQHAQRRVHPMPVQWVTTGRARGASNAGWDAGQRGWRLHAIVAHPHESTEAVADVRALCGVLPAHGWGLDMFIDRPCSRCAKLATFEVRR